MRDGLGCGHRRRLPAVESRPKGRKHVWLVGVYRKRRGRWGGLQRRTEPELGSVPNAM